MTAGEKFRKDNPDWPHECCYPPPCPYRGKGKAKRCEAPGGCHYYVPLKEEEKSEGGKP